MTLLKKTPTPSFEDRLNAAHATADAAASVVEKIANDLDIAAGEKSALILDIDAETTRLLDQVANLDELRREVVDAESATLAKATKIRALLSA